MTAPESRKDRVRAKLFLPPESQGAADTFEDIRERLSRRIDPGMYTSWFAGNSRTEIVACTADTITIAARSSWFAKQIRQRFERQILEAACVPSLKIVVRT